MNSRQFRNYILLGLTAALLCSGCSKLRISVDVYKGQLINSREAQMGEAVGLARSAYSTVTDLQSKAIREDKHRLFRRRPKTPVLLADHMNEVVRAYKGVAGEKGIDKLWAEYTSIRIADPRRGEARTEAPDHCRTERCRDEVGAELARALFRFGTLCEGLGRMRGLPEAIKLHHILFMPSFRIGEFREGVGLEEAGRWIKFLTDSAVDSTSRTSIARLMQSVTTGHAGTMASESPWLLSQSVDRGLDKTYWSEINEIDVVGVGATEYVIVKDEIGNWHIKSLIADQDEIVNAVFDGAEAMVGILAAYYGVDASRAPISDTNVPQVSSSFVDRQLKAAKADRTAGTLSSAKLGLQVALVAAMKENDAKTLGKLIKNAVHTYAAQIDGIGSGDDE